MKPRTIGLLASQTIRNLKRTTAATSMAVVMACMVALSLFTLVAINLTVIGKQLQSGVEVRVFLEDGIALPVKESLQKAIRALPGVRKVQYVSRDEALNRLSRQLGDENNFFLPDMPRNPLPDSLDVSIARAEEAQMIAGQIAAMEGVDDIQYGQKIVENLVGALKVLWGVTGAIAVLVLLGASLVVSNTIKLSVFARRREIEIMKLVGATDGFILFPFVLEGLIIGLVGAAAAAAMVFAAYCAVANWIRSVVPILQVALNTAWLGTAAGGIIGFGAVVGLTGSAISVRRYLRV